MKLDTRELMHIWCSDIYARKSLDAFFFLFFWLFYFHWVCSVCLLQLTIGKRMNSVCVMWLSWSILDLDFLGCMLCSMYVKYFFSLCVCHLLRQTLKQTFNFCVGPKLLNFNITGYYYAELCWCSCPLHISAVYIV